MTVKEYLNARHSNTYGKKIRILNQKTGRNCGNCVNNFNASVSATKITSKFLFIYVDK